MTQVLALKARARQLAADDDLTLLFSFGKCDWSAVADFLTDTLSAIPDASTGARTGVGMDWPAVLRMMLKQKQCTECVQHQRLALSLCTICVGLVIRMAGTAVKVESDVTRSARNVLLEALSSDCEHSDQQSACVLKVLRSASFQVVGLSSDQASTCPQKLALHVLEQLLEQPQSTVAGIANQDVWEQLVLSWNAVRSENLATNHQSQELQYATTPRLCADTADVLSKASFCSNNMRSSVTAALQQVPPDSVVPAAELLLTQALPNPCDLRSRLPKAVSSILGLLLNVTHQSKEMSQCCGSQVPLTRLARSLHSACRTLAKSKASSEPDDGNTELFSLVAMLLCILINIVENSPAAGVQLAQMDMATAPVEAPSATPLHSRGKSASEPACKDIDHSVEVLSLSQAPCKQARVQSVPTECPHVDVVTDLQNGIFDEFRAKEDDLLLMCGSQSSGLQSRRLGRSRSSQQRTSATSSLSGKPRYKKRQSPSNKIPAKMSKEISEGETVVKEKQTKNDLPRVTNTFLDYLCHRIMSRDTYSHRDAACKSSDSSANLSTDIRSLMGLLAGYLLMGLPQQKSVDRLLVGEVQCIVREALVRSGQADASDSTDLLLQWARGRQG